MHRCLGMGMLLTLAVGTGGAQPGSGDWNDPGQVEALNRAHQEMEAVKAALQASKLAGKRDAGRVRSSAAFGGAVTARPDFDKAMRAAANDGERLASLAYWLAPENDMKLGDLALEAYQAALRVDGSKELWWRNYAVTLAQMQRYPQAAQASHMANQLATVASGLARFSLHVYLARTLADAGLRAVAKELLVDIENPGQLVALDKAIMDGILGAERAGAIDLGFKSRDAPGGNLGAEVYHLTPGGLADSWGLEQGDELRKVGHTRITNDKELQEALQGTAGDSIRFMLRRQGRIVFVEGVVSAAGTRPRSEALEKEGLARFDAGDLEGASARFREATEVDRTNADAWYNLGLARRRAGDAVGAATGLGAALALGLDPATAEQVQAAMAKIAAGVRTPLPALVPEEVAVLTESGHQYLRRNEPIQALLDYLRALHQAPGAPLALFGAFGVAETMGLKSLAIRLGETYLRVFPSTPNRTKVLARLHRLRTGIDLGASVAGGS